MTLYPHPAPHNLRSPHMASFLALMLCKIFSIFPQMHQFLFCFFIFFKLLDSALFWSRAQRQSKFWGPFLSRLPGERVGIPILTGPPSAEIIIIVLIIIDYFVLLFADCFNLGAAIDFDRG